MVLVPHKRQPITNKLHKKPTRTQKYIPHTQTEWFSFNRRDTPYLLNMPEYEHNVLGWLQAASAHFLTHVRHVRLHKPAFIHTMIYVIVFGARYITNVYNNRVTICINLRSAAKLSINMPRSAAKRSEEFRKSYDLVLSICSECHNRGNIQQKYTFRNVTCSTVQVPPTAIRITFAGRPRN